MIRRIMACALAAIMALCLITGCETAYAPELNIEEYSGFGDVLNLSDNSVTAVTQQGSLGFSIWSYQLGDKKDAEEYVALLNDMGFESIDLSVIWSDFEVEENKYNWSFIDDIMDIFVGAGYKLNLSIVFWTYNLSFKEKLDLQKTALGETYYYDEVRSGFLCLSSEKNLRYMEDAILAFASHVYDKYPEDILSWQIKVSELGEMEYSSTVDLDYSDQSYSAFLGYIKNKYGKISSFNAAYKQSFESWEELSKEKMTTVTSLCSFDWKHFKQHTLISAQNRASAVFKAVCEEIPVAMNIGTVGDSMSAVYRGIFDPYTVATQCECDIIQADYFTSKHYNFYPDMLTYTTGKDICYQTDGPWQGEEELEKSLLLTQWAGKTGIKSMSVANWTKTDISEYEDFLEEYDVNFASSESRPNPDVTDIIIINTLDFIIRQPPSSMYELYKNAYRNMTGSKNEKVIILTDTQVIANPSLLDGVKKIHLGALNNVTYMYDALGKILTDGRYTLIDDDNQQPNFINQYSEPLDIDVQTEMRERLENS